MPFDIDPQYVETPAEVKPDVFSLDGLIAWLEKQPADIEYCYRDHGRCLAAQFNAACCREYKVPAAGLIVCFHDGEWRVDVDALCHADFPLQLEKIAVNTPHIFGEALIRAKALRVLAERQS